ncbi:MAG TPA: aldo/keto reductase [Candidatus Brocadiia bacterium]|nr:aldo/keto reductase [Candidatus Brocadiia bacterium]
MQRRPLGRTGEKLSIAGFGGLVAKDEPPDALRRIVASAVERGVNYFDIGPSYGNAEERLGPALEPHRGQVFLAGKTLQRTAAGARAELEASLRRLHTGHLDLWQHHAVCTLAEAQQILAPGGALEAFVKAREQGLVRFLGVTAHSEEAALALIHAFAYDTILFPINWAAWLRHGFGRRVVEQAQAKGMGILALKALARRAAAKGEDKPWKKCWYVPVESQEEAALAFRFTLSLPVTSAVSPSHAELLQWTLDAADAFTPLTPGEEALLRQRSQTLCPVFPKPS